MGILTLLSILVVAFFDTAIINNGENDNAYIVIINSGDNTNAITQKKIILLQSPLYNGNNTDAFIAIIKHGDNTNAIINNENSVINA